MQQSEKQLFIDTYKSINQSLQNNEQSFQQTFNHLHYNFLLNCLQQPNLIKQEDSNNLQTIFLDLVNSNLHDHIEGGFLNVSGHSNNNQPYEKNLFNNAQLISLFTDFSGYFLDGFFSVPAINASQ